MAAPAGEGENPEELKPRRGTAPGSGQPPRLEERTPTKLATPEGAAYEPELQGLHLRKRFGVSGDDRVADRTSRGAGRTERYTSLVEGETSEG